MRVMGRSRRRRRRRRRRSGGGGKERAKEGERSRRSVS
jgi:hypothetical protein